MQEPHFVRVANQELNCYKAAIIWKNREIAGSAMGRTRKRKSVEARKRDGQAWKRRHADTQARSPQLVLRSFLYTGTLD